MVCEIVGHFANTFTANDKNYLPNRENLLQSIQMHLSKKWLIFSEFLMHSWNLYQFLNILKNKMTVIAYVFPKLQAAKDQWVRPMSKKPRFSTLFNSQHVKASQTLVKSGWLHFYQTSSSQWAKLTWKSVKWKGTLVKL